MYREETLFYQFKIESIGLIWGFDDYSHLFSSDEDVIYLKPIYLLPFQALPDLISFKQKQLQDGRYYNLLYTKEHSGYRINNSCWIKNYLISQGAQEISAKFKDQFSSRFFAVSPKDVIQCASPRVCLQKICSENRHLAGIIRNISALFGLPAGQLGITGSLSLGAADYQDIDIVIYGTSEEISRVKRVIHEQQILHGPIVEHGKKWPCRFRDSENNIICCFFNYTDHVYSKVTDILLPLIESNQRCCSFRETIIDDAYSFSKTPIYQLSGEKYDWLVVLSREFRGRLQKGNKISGSALWGYTSDNQKVLVVFEPYRELKVCNEISDERNR